MKPLLILIGSFLISLLVLKLVTKQIDFQLAGKISMAIMLFFTALGHFMFTKGMAAMIPAFLPMKTELVYATGILEILFAIGLVYPKYSYLTGILLILFFILILPSNIKAAVDGLNYQTGELDGHGLSYLWFRVPLQLLFIIWVYFSAVKFNV
ncbi:DoxX family protein [Arcticibacterium luteifluviistationis]|uniref:DoxX family protein n=1 Tax=Arcticibacterium luteifluviistationis TaxID=1784714 RepID=A0A2Z4GIT9_9BACT|nr:hypothetical protein [Arcticibacterium luteifluviistationis]AWW00884.1 hypothetical protein DJ013_11400 [Arcticibacterium luteifluviistationis]